MSNCSTHGAKTATSAYKMVCFPRFPISAGLSEVHETSLRRSDEHSEGDFDVIPTQLFPDPNPIVEQFLVWRKLAFKETFF